MRNPPHIPSSPSEQLCASHVKHPPAIPPPNHLSLAIRLPQSFHHTSFIPVHGAQPVLARLGVVHPADPPLPNDPQARRREEQQQVRARHRAAREEVLGHPPILEVVRRVAVREDVHEEPAPGFQRRLHGAHEEGVVFHVLEKLDAEDAVVRRGGEGVRGYVGGDDGDVGEVLRRGDGVDVQFLRGGVAEGCYAAVGEARSEVEGQGAPATS